MQLATSREVFNYWNWVRGTRPAPQRYEIEPKKVAAQLPEMFIGECRAPGLYYLRLAGTRICTVYGQEMKGIDLLSMWHDVEDREAFASLLHTVTTDAAVGTATYVAYTGDNASVRLEMTLLPLVHADTQINRLLGSISAIDTPYWLGSRRLVSQNLTDISLIWPDGQPTLFANTADEHASRLATLSPQGGEPHSPLLRVIDGGRSGTL